MVVDDRLLSHTKPEYRRLLKTTSGMEHGHAEARSRSRVVRIFPNDASLDARNEQWLERSCILFNDATDERQRVARSARASGVARRIKLQKDQH